jgi:hypothetical protein
MNSIGIDYSMNSVGITVRHNSNTFFYSVVNSYSLSKAKDFDINKNGGMSKDVLNSLDGYKIIRRIPYTKNKENSKLVELNAWHNALLVGSEELSSEVMTFLNPFLKDCEFVVFENYITRNGGDTTIQIIEFTKDLKSKIYASGFKNIKIISAPEVKMFAGGGNFTKEDMFNAFLLHHRNSKFHDFLTKNKKLLIKNSKEIIKPVDDVIDSYFILEAFSQNYTQSM